MFRNNTKIVKFNELVLFTNVTQSPNFEGCSKLQQWDGTNIKTRSGHIGGWSLHSITSHNTAGVAYFPNMENLSGTDTGCRYLTKWFLPKYKTSSNWPFRGIASGSLMDYGPESTALRLDYASQATVVIRNTTPPSVSSISSAETIYVPASAVETYKANSTFSGKASVIYAIGGAEWTAAFGSSDEYADYDLYGVPHS